VSVREYLFFLVRFPAERTHFFTFDVCKNEKCSGILNKWVGAEPPTQLKIQRLVSRPLLRATVSPSGTPKTENPPKCRARQIWGYVPGFAVCDLKAFWGLFGFDYLQGV